MAVNNNLLNEGISSLVPGLAALPRSFSAINCQKANLRRRILLQRIEESEPLSKCDLHIFPL